MMNFKLLAVFVLFCSVQSTLQGLIGKREYFYLTSIGKINDKLSRLAAKTVSCEAGEPHCCNQLTNKNKLQGVASILSTIIGPVSDLFESFSLNCVPINAIGTSSAGCVVQNACCTSKQQGIIVFACNNINAAG